MGYLKEEDKAKLREILRKGADAEADVIIDFTEKIYGAMPEGGDAKEWAEKQAQAFNEARLEMTRKFTDLARNKMGMADEG